MKRRTFIKSGLLAAAGAPLLQGCLSGKDGITGNELYSLFHRPPSSSKPFVRWWWNGDKLSATEIARELDIMQAAGIGGVEINPIAFPGGDDLGIKSLEWLSPEWIEMVKVALVEAAKRDITADIIVGSGWPFGGEFLTPEDQTQLMTRASIFVDGAGRQTVKIDDLLTEAAPRVHSGYKGASSEVHALWLAPTKMDVFAPCTPISLPEGGGKAGGEVSFDVPAGRHVLYALVKITGFQSVINGAPGAAGPVLNHYSTPAVQKFLDRMSDKLFPAIAGLKGFRALFCDSMELEGANWFAGMPDEFKRRRGYDVTPYLPFILHKVGGMGQVIKSLAETEMSGAAKEEVARVRYDFFTVCMEVMRDNFLRPYTKWCNKHGFKSRVQAYGLEFHPLEASLEVDIPECETWMWFADGNVKDNLSRNPGYTNVNKYVASAARLSGKKIVSCEEVTNTGAVFNATLERIKMIGDQSNLSGVTHSILHGFNYSPLEAPFPGWIRYGTFFNERNPWWKWFHLWAEYKARLSTVFQEADPYANIAVLQPLADMWTKHGPQRDPFPNLHYPKYQYRVWEAIHRNGDACDYTSERIMQKSRFKNGFMTYGKRKYSTLLCIETETVEPATAKAMADFAAAGGKLIFVGKEPHLSPGRPNGANEKRDAEVKEFIASIKSKYPSQVFTVVAPDGDDLTGWYGDVQRQCGLKPYLEIASPNVFVNQMRYQADGRDFIFMANCSATERFVSEMRFTEANGRTAVVWDAETGERFAYPSVEGGKFKVELYPATSQLIVFEPAAEAGNLPEWTGMLPAAEGDELAGWRVELLWADGKKQELTMDALFDIGADPELQSFYGEIRYRASVDCVRQWRFIDLGRVHGVSTLKINGEEIGCRWYGRHAYVLPEHIAKSDRLEIEASVTPIVGNYIKAHPENHAHGWVRGQPWQPVGMLGKVTLV